MDKSVSQYLVFDFWSLCTKPERKLASCGEELCLIGISEFIAQLYNGDGFLLQLT